MTLRNIIISKTILSEQILTEEKVTAFVKNVLDRYNNIRAPRVEAARYWSNKNPKDKALYDDNIRPLNVWNFRTKAIEAFRKLNKTKMKDIDFENILDLYLSNYDKESGILL